jgi:hypothetical protein
MGRKTINNGYEIEAFTPGKNLGQFLPFSDFRRGMQ